MAHSRAEADFGRIPARCPVPEELGWAHPGRGELWLGGPGQARVSRWRNLAPHSSMVWCCAPGAHDHPSPGVPRERLPKDHITPRGGWRGVGPRPRGGLPPLTPRRPGRGRADPNLTSAQARARVDKARRPGDSGSVGTAADQPTGREAPVKREAARLKWA